MGYDNHNSTLNMLTGRMGRAECCNFCMDIIGEVFQEIDPDKALGVDIIKL